MAPARSSSTRYHRSVSSTRVSKPAHPQIATLTEVIAHYDRAPRAPFGHSELRRLRLSAAERRQLEAFLRTLSAPPLVGSR